MPQLNKRGQYFDLQEKRRKRRKAGLPHLPLPFLEKLAFAITNKIRKFKPGPVPLTIPVICQSRCRISAASPAACHVSMTIMGRASGLCKQPCLGLEPKQKGARTASTAVSMPAAMGRVPMRQRGKMQRILGGR